ncbi:MAG TPA: AMP-binding protein, partial [Candidatus Omnitrophota bacterium]|nr:AMP-binding protein [Candidatus Omnitrophota bacterium]
FGIMAVGAVAVPIDPKLTPGEIINLLRDSQAKILFSSPELFPSLKDLLKDIQGLKKTLLYPFPEITASKPAREINTADKSEWTASLLYTSGTTASPKGVMLTQKNFCSNFESISKLNIVTAKDNIVSLLPLHHSYPFMVCLILPLLTGAKITFLNSLKSEDLLKCLRETKGAILVGVPQLYHLLHKSILEKIGKPETLLSLLKIVNWTRRAFGLNLNKIILKKLHQRFGPSLRFFFSGGARLEPKAARELSLLGFNLLEGYGLTETSPVVTFTPPGSAKFGSAGLPIPGVKIKILNPNAEGIGEVLIKGPNVMQGYYNKPQESQEALKDGWFYSGDLGYIDKDGYLFLTGRSKEVIVLASGKNIYPEEIEAYYLKDPYIKEICVLETSAGGSSSLYAVVLPDIEYFRKAKEVNIQGKIRWSLEDLSKGLPSYKRIMGWTLARDEFPRTRLGKLKRYEIKAKYLAPLPKESPETVKTKEEALPPADKLERQIIEFLGRELKRKVSPSDHLELDLGIDSLTRVELAIGLEKIFNLNLADTDMADVFSVKELIEKIRCLLEQRQKIGDADK